MTAPKKRAHRSRIIDTTGEVVGEIEQESSPDMDDSALFDAIAGDMEDAKVHLSRLNLDTGNYAHVGVLPCPATVEEISRRWGGGAYKWEIRKGGQYVRGGRLEIDTSVFPPKGGEKRSESLQENPIQSRLSRIEERLAQIVAGGAGPSFHDMAVTFRELLRPAEPGLEKVVEALKTGIDVARNAGSGEAREKGIVDVIADVLPKFLENLQASHAQEAAFARGLHPTSTALPGTTPAKPDALAEIVAAAKRNEDTKPYAAKLLAELPDAYIAFAMNSDAPTLIRFIAGRVPATERTFLASAPAVQWTMRLLDDMKKLDSEGEGPEREPESEGGSVVSPTGTP